MSRDLYLMPPEAPRAMPVQDFARHHRDSQAPDAPVERGVGLWRWLAFCPALLATALLLWLMIGWFSEAGISTVEGVLLTLICFNFFWISFTLSTVTLGLWSLTRAAPRPSATPPEPLNVALLMPVYNEVPWYVLGNARSMLEELRARGGAHRYAMFILSDTRDDAIAAQEQESVRALQAMLSPGLELYYRRRPENTDRKVGNIANWVARWGGAWDAMLVLDDYGRYLLLLALLPAALLLPRKNLT